MTENWMPSDEKIDDAWVNDGQESGMRFPAIEALIREAVQKAVAEERARLQRIWLDNLMTIHDRHARELEQARLETERHVLSRFGYSGKGSDHNDIRVREIEIALATLDKEGE